VSQGCSWHGWAIKRWHDKEGKSEGIAGSCRKSGLAACIYHFCAIARCESDAAAAPLSHSRHRPRPAPSNGLTRERKRDANRSIVLLISARSTARGRATGIDSSPIREAFVRAWIALSLSLSLSLSFSLSFWSLGEHREQHDTTERASRDAHTREARNRLARLARRDLRPLRQRHLLHTDAAPAVARPHRRSPDIALPCDM